MARVVPPRGGMAALMNASRASRGVVEVEGVAHSIAAVEREKLVLAMAVREVQRSSRVGEVRMQCFEATRQRRSARERSERLCTRVDR